MARSYNAHKADADTAIPVPDIAWRSLASDPEGLTGGALGIAEFDITFAGTGHQYAAILVHSGTTEQWYVVDLARRQLASRFGYSVIAGPRRSWTAIRDAFVGQWRKVVNAEREKYAARAYGKDVFDDPVSSEAKLRRFDLSANVQLDQDFDQDIFSYVITGRGNFTITNIRLSAGARAVWTRNGDVIDIADPIAFSPVQGRDVALAATVIPQDSSTSRVYTFTVRQT